MTWTNINEVFDELEEKYKNIRMNKKRVPVDYVNEFWYKVDEKCYNVNDVTIYMVLESEGAQQIVKATEINDLFKISTCSFQGIYGFFTGYLNYILSLNTLIRESDRANYVREFVKEFLPAKVPNDIKTPLLLTLIT